MANFAVACPAGFHFVESTGLCTSCATGTYKASSGSESCSACAGCSTGQYRSGCGGVLAGSCLACASGRYKTSNGSEACSQCTGCTGMQHRQETRAHRTTQAKANQRANPTHIVRCRLKHPGNHRGNELRALRRHGTSKITTKIRSRTANLNVNIEDYNEDSVPDCQS